MRWNVRSEKPLYRDDWLDIRLADVELPNRRHINHRLIRLAPGAGCVIFDDRDRVLLLWRHRFITDTWGYEIPIGQINPGESPAEAARRECEEETGWRPSRLEPLIYTQPTPGVSDSEHHIFIGREAVRTGDPVDTLEADRIEWVPATQIRELIGTRQISSGTTLAALLFAICRE